MKLLSRIKRLFLSNADDLVDRLTCEEKVLKYTVKQMHDKINKARDALVKMIVNYKQMERKLFDAETYLKELKQSAGREVDDYTKCLALISAKQSQERLVKEYEVSLEIQAGNIERIKQEMEVAKLQIKQVECNKDILLSRKAVAEARHIIFHDLNIDNSIMDEMENKILYRETVADVYEEMNGSNTYSDEVLAEYEYLKRKDS